MSSATFVWKTFYIHYLFRWHLGMCNWDCTPTYRGFDSFFGFYNAKAGYYSHISCKKIHVGKYTSVYFNIIVFVLNSFSYQLLRSEIGKSKNIQAAIKILYRMLKSYNSFAQINSGFWIPSGSFYSGRKLQISYRKIVFSMGKVIFL